MAGHTEGGALDCFRRYAEAFRALDSKAVAAHFAQPALLITPHGVTALATAAEVEQAYGRIMADLRTQDYERTEFSSLDERLLNDELAVVSGSGFWRKTTGEAFAPFAMMYTLRRTGGSWRIVVAMIYRPGSTPPSTS